MGYRCIGLKMAGFSGIGLLIDLLCLRLVATPKASSFVNAILNSPGPRHSCVADEVFEVSSAQHTMRIAFRACFVWRLRAFGIMD